MAIHKTTRRHCIHIRNMFIGSAAITYAQVKSIFMHYLIEKYNVKGFIYSVALIKCFNCTHTSYLSHTSHYALEKLRLITYNNQMSIKNRDFNFSKTLNLCIPFLNRKLPEIYQVSFIKSNFYIFSSDCNTSI